jgi:hypothetical protein
VLAYCPAVVVVKLKMKEKEVIHAMAMLHLQMNKQQHTLSKTKMVQMIIKNNNIHLLTMLKKDTKICPNIHLPINIIIWLSILCVLSINFWLISAN